MKFVKLKDVIIGREMTHASCPLNHIFFVKSLSQTQVLVFYVDVKILLLFTLSISEKSSYESSKASEVHIFELESCEESLDMEIISFYLVHVYTDLSNENLVIGK